ARRQAGALDRRPQLSAELDRAAARRLQSADDLMAPSFTKTIVEPAESSRLAPVATGVHGDRVWVYRYRHRSEPWTLAIATHAEPGSQKLSLGGFRIAPPERTSLPGFDPVREAIELAVGMEEKVYWSRLLQIGGPLTQRDFARIVGGKCVLEPTSDARV